MIDVAVATLPRNTILGGDALWWLYTLPSDSIHCCITSPPYFGLRNYDSEPLVWGGDDTCTHSWGSWQESHEVREETLVGKTRTTLRHYGDDETCRFNGNHQKHSAGSTCILCGAWYGQLGLESTPDLYISHLVLIFREVRRVLRKDGTFWLNMGDSYAGSMQGARADGTQYAGHKQATNRGSVTLGRRPDWSHVDAKPKDLLGMPWMLAFALRADGWWLRADCIWEKPNAMPESVRDRPTKSHEYVFLLTKSQHYYYDADAIREPHQTKNLDYEMQKASKWGHKKAATTKNNIAKYNGGGPTHSYDPAGRNKRDVWHINTCPFPEAHFAVFPPELAELCLLAGTSPQACEYCGAAWKRVRGKELSSAAPTAAEHLRSAAEMRGIPLDEKHPGTGSRGRSSARLYLPRSPASIYQDKGWEPSCACSNDGAGRCMVLDPFMGAGTVGLVAKRHGRDYLGIELKEEYIELAERRIKGNQ